MDEIFAKMLVELDQDARYKLVQDWYNTFWEYVPYVKTMYYLDVDFYRYYIGREDQSVNEKNMIKNILEIN
jgi:ABC-type transport system substrate-binding protein